MQMSANAMDTMMPRPLYPRFHRAINVSIISYPFPSSSLSIHAIDHFAISHCRELVGMVSISPLLLPPATGASSTC